jgi:hypothetical protein
MNGSQRLVPNVAQAGDEFHGPGLCCVLSFHAGWSGPCFGSLGRMWPRWAMSFAAQAFAAFLNFYAGWSGPYFSLGPKSHKDFYGFLFFLFLGKQNK